MREQGSNAWGLTVSRRFESAGQASRAVDDLRKAGFREEEIRVWQHSNLSAPYEGRVGRTTEGFLAGGVIAGLLGFLLAVSIAWANSERIDMEVSAGAALIAAVAGAVLTAIAVNIISTKVAFSHPHHHPSEPPSIVTVTVGDREAEARRVLTSQNAHNS